MADQEQDQEQRGAGGPPKPSDLLSRYNGDAVRLAERLSDALDDAYKHRKRRDELQGQLDALSARVPSEGSVVLNADEASAYQAYIALGKPQELSERLEQAETAAADAKSLRRQATIRDAAQVSGYKPAVLERLAADLTLELRDLTENGQTVKAAFVRDGDRPETPLRQYAEQHWPDFLPALRAESDTRTGVVPPVGNAATNDAENGARQYLQRAYVNPFAKQGAA